MKKLLVFGCVIIVMGSSVSTGTEGLVAYWPFDTDFTNAEGTAAYDGIPAGTAEISDEDVKVGAGALKIDDNTSSANHVVAMGDFIGPAPVVRTVVGWYKYEDISNDGSDARNFIWETQPTYSLSFGIRDGAEGKYSQWYHDTQTGAINGNGPVVDDGRWHHAALVWNSELGHVKYYHDGQLLETRAIDPGNNPRLDQVGFNIGTHRAADGGRNWDGYLDEIAIFSVELTAEQVLDLYELPRAVTPLNIFTREVARNLHPRIDSTDVVRDVVLSWEPGFSAVKHNVYFGTNFDDVDSADTANPLDVLVSEGQEAASYDVGRLEFGQTYYWRIDEVMGAPDNAVFKGMVWSFTVEPFAYTIDSVVATSPLIAAEDQGPENTVNGSGLNEDEHSTEPDDMWTATIDVNEPEIIRFEFDRLYKMNDMRIWNHNLAFESLLGIGLMEVTIEYSADGLDWAILNDVELPQAPGQATYAGTVVPLEGVAARFIRLVDGSAWLSTNQLGLGEVRFTYIPAHAREPQPEDGATDVPPDAVLSWRAGREAASHDIYLGADPNALELGDSTTQNRYAPAGLDLGTTYTWWIDEVNEIEVVTSWASDVWTFSTQEFLVVDDFESYIDDPTAGDVIWEIWIDGWVAEGGDPDNGGSVVGNATSPFAEQTIVHSGIQSMPITYDNSSSPFYSEVDKVFDTPQDWTPYGIKTLSLYFRGLIDNGGQLYVKINDVKQLYDGDPADIAKTVWQPWNIDLTTFGNEAANVRSLTIGVEGANAQGILYVDDIRLFSKPVELITPAEPDTGNRVGWWTFDDGSGTVAADSSGQGNDATLETGELQWLPGTIDGALDFDGVRHRLMLASPLTVGSSSNTLATWVKVPLIGNRNLDAGERVGVVLGNYPDSPNTNWELHDDGQMRIYWNGGQINAYGKTDLRDDTWHHIAWVRDKAADACYMYIDGHLETIVSSAGGDVTFTTNHLIGADGRGESSLHFHGLMDDLQLYGEALSPAEIAWLAGLRTPMHVPF